LFHRRKLFAQLHDFILALENFGGTALDSRATFPPPFSTGIADWPLAREGSKSGRRDLIGKPHDALIPPSTRRARTHRGRAS